MFRFLYLCLASFAIASMFAFHFPGLEGHAFNLSTLNVSWFAVCGVVCMFLGHKVTSGKR
jgi:hypothetical protein